MSVWYAVVASMAYMLYVAPYYEWSIGIKVALLIIHGVTFFGGMMYDMNRQEKIKKLEKEIEKLKVERIFGRIDE